MELKDAEKTEFRNLRQGDLFYYNTFNFMKKYCVVHGKTLNALNLDQKNFSAQFEPHVQVIRKGNIKYEEA